MSRTIMAVAALAFGTASLAAWFGWVSATERGRIAELEKALQQARSRPLPAPALPEARPPAPEPAQPTAEPARRRSAESTANPEADLLRMKLSQSADAMQKLQAQVQQLREQIETLNLERAADAQSESQLRTRLDEVSRTVTAISAERSTLGSRVAELESANAKLRDASADAQRKNAQFGRLTSELEDIGRRQQMYLMNILRRYREVTDLFRAYPEMVENRGNAPELSRIQSAVSMADEDMKQLSELNARVGRVQKQIAATTKP